MARDGKEMFRQEKEFLGWKLQYFYQFWRPPFLICSSYWQTEKKEERGKTEKTPPTLWAFFPRTRPTGHSSPQRKSGQKSREKRWSEPTVLLLSQGSSRAPFSSMGMGSSGVRRWQRGNEKTQRIWRNDNAEKKKKCILSKEMYFEVETPR